MPGLEGSLLGKYLLLRKLGDGGFAEVYLGEHSKLKTQAAIKVQPARLSSTDLARFLDEARTIAGLTHQHILRILDYDDEGGVPFLVMDYAPNGSLRQRYPAGTVVPLETILPYVQQVAEALQYAHDQNPPIVHRDIKPENMLLGRNGEVFLADFGIAITVTQYVHPRDPIGTAAYMAPEMFRGEPHRASDQYALAVVIYEWLCGALPFKGPGYLQFGYQHVQEPPPPMRDKVPLIPREVEEVVLKALSKDPQARFASVRAFIEVLEAAHKGTQYPQVGKVLLTYTGHADTVYAVAWSPDGRHLASVGKDKTVQVWDATANEHILTYKDHASYVNGVAWSPDARRLASGGGDSWSENSDNTVQVWDAATGQRLLTYTNHTEVVQTLAWAPDGARLASGDSGNPATVQVWDATTGQHLLTYTGHTYSVQSVAWSPDGKHVASASSDKTVQVWDAITGRCLNTYTGHSSWIWSVAWSPDGKCLASAGGDRTVHVWDATTGKRLLTCRGHTATLKSLAWSPDSKRLASASGDGTARIYETTTGQCLAIYRRHTSAVWAVAWSPDGRRIASGGADMTVQVWSAG